MRTTITATNSAIPTRVAWRVLGVVGFALLTAAGAQVVIPLPHTPVPITLQTLFVVLAGVALGPRLGAASMTLYVLLGTAGHHVFAGATGGLPTLFGATGGYLLGFIAAPPIVGLLAQRRTARPGALLIAVLAGHAIIFACGVTWLAIALGVSLPAALALGLWPFLPGCALKTLIAVDVGRVLLRRQFRVPN